MSSKFIIDTDGAPRSYGAYSQAVSFGPLLFTSGILPIDIVKGDILRGGIEAQAKLVLDHLLNILSSAGLRSEHVIKTTLYLRNRNDLEAVERVYSRYFDYAAPARTVVEVSRLEQDALLCLEAVAVIPESLEPIAHRVEKPNDDTAISHVSDHVESDPITPDLVEKIDGSTPDDTSITDETNIRCDVDDSKKVDPIQESTKSQNDVQ